MCVHIWIIPNEHYRWVLSIQTHWALLRAKCWFGVFVSHLSQIPDKSVYSTFPNSVGKFLPFFVSTSVWLFYIRSKIFLYLANLWVLLFQTIYCWSFMLHVFIVELSVYEKYLYLTELVRSSLILMFLIKYIEKLNFRKKTIFSCFRWEMKGRCLRHFCRADQTLS
jgi:hypothetical protein